MRHEEIGNGKKLLSLTGLKGYRAVVMLLMQPWLMGFQVDAIIIDGFSHFQN